MGLDGAPYESPRYLVEEFAEAYRFGRLNRREMLRRVLLITGSAAVTASTLLALGCGTEKKAVAPTPTGAPLNTVGTPAVRIATVAPAASPSPAAGTLGAATMPPLQQTDQLVVSETDPAIQAQSVQFPGQAGTVFGYLAGPRAGGKGQALIVIPENLGLVEPNLDIARRFAKEGFVALAVDTISRAGGTDKFTQDPAQISAALSRIAMADVVSDLRSGIAYLQTLDGVQNSAVGVTGYCIGGNFTFALAIAAPEIRATVPFYGMVNSADLAKSRAAFLIFYAGNDTRVTSQDPDVEAALRQAGRTFEVHIEQGADHPFFNNMRPTYNPAAARDAWPRTLAWFAQYIKA